MSTIIQAQLQASVMLAIDCLIGKRRDSWPDLLMNTPLKLEHFLQAAEQNGIPGVLSFHPMLSEKGYGPDIMHLISVSDLGNIGMAPGDAICLREYALRWCFRMPD